MRESGLDVTASEFANTLWRVLYGTKDETDLQAIKRYLKKNANRTFEIERHNFVMKEISATRLRVVPLCTDEEKLKLCRYLSECGNIGIISIKCAPCNPSSHLLQVYADMDIDLSFIESVGCEEELFHLADTLITCGFDSSKLLRICCSKLRPQRQLIELLLISLHADPNESDAKFENAVFALLNNKPISWWDDNSWQIIKLLFDNGVNLLSIGHQGLTPLCYAFSRFIECVNVIVDVLHHVIPKSNSALRMEILQSIKSQNFLFTLSDIRITKENCEYVSEFFCYATDVNEIDFYFSNEGQTMLMTAANCGYLDMVQVLLDAGANPNIQNNRGQKAWDYAASSRAANSEKIREVILKAQEKNDLKDSKRRRIE